MTDQTAEKVPTWRVRSTHDVTMYGGRSTPCFCYADQNHTVGQEHRTSPGQDATTDQRATADEESR